jgi:uncharacterized membrane protein YkvA (DUF1232 family)
VHYSDDDTPRRARNEDDDGPRRGGAPRPASSRAEDDEELVGPRRGASGRARRRSILDDDEDAPVRAAAAPRRGGRGDRGGLSREALLGLVRDLPNFAKLLARLATDRRVSKVDKAIVGAVLVYFVSPIDLIPDWVVPVVGQMEDIYLLALALSRLVNNAGIDVLLDHWDGEPASLEAALGVLDRAGSVLPGPVQAILGGRR